MELATIFRLISCVLSQFCKYDCDAPLEDLQMCLSNVNTTTCTSFNSTDKVTEIVYRNTNFGNIVNNFSVLCCFGSRWGKISSCDYVEAEWPEFEGNGQLVNRYLTAVGLADFQQWEKSELAKRLNFWVLLCLSRALIAL